MRIISWLKTEFFLVKFHFFLAGKCPLIHRVSDRPAKMVICFPKPLLASQVRLFHLKEARSAAEAEYEENKVAIGTVFRGKVEGVLEQMSLRK